jgi:hypothetical protein
MYAVWTYQIVLYTISHSNDMQRTACCDNRLKDFSHHEQGKWTVIVETFIMPWPSTLTAVSFISKFLGKLAMARHSCLSTVTDLRRWFNDFEKFGLRTSLSMQCFN